MHSEDYKALMDKLFNQKHKINKIDIRFGESIRSKLTFDDSSILETEEDDANDYVLNLKQVIDRDGDFVFKPVIDTESYMNDEEFLARDHDEKMVAASHELAGGAFKFSYNPDELQEEFLMDKNRNDRKYLPLKDDYFRIAAYRMNEAGTILKLHEKHLKDSPEYEKQFLVVCKILSTAFRNDANFLKNFANRSRKAKLNLLESLNKYTSALQGAQDIKPIFEPSGIKADAGIHLVLDAYRKYAEACVEPLNFLRIAHELNTGITHPLVDKKAQENKAILMSEMGSILDCFNPHLRNSESHLNTRFNHKDHKLLITDRDNYSHEYTYSEITQMTNDLAHNLLPALIIGLTMESQVVMLILSTRSIEYISALLGIDNT